MLKRTFDYLLIIFVILVILKSVFDQDLVNLDYFLIILAVLAIIALIFRLRK